MIFIDSDIFVIDLRYRQDKKYPANKQFLDQAFAEGWGTTSIFNILEVCGILSFNLNKKQLIELYHHFPRKYNLCDIQPLKPGQSLPDLKISSLLNAMGSKSSFGDALIICASKAKMSSLQYFVSWDARHFEGRMDVSVLTPSDYLEIPWQNQRK